MQQFDSRAYPKGAWVLHMLRSQLGPDLFRKCIKTYLERHRSGIVSTDDLQDVVEEVSGCRSTSSSINGCITAACRS
jgi:aminopeptidase N